MRHHFPWKTLTGVLLVIVLILAFVYFTTRHPQVSPPSVPSPSASAKATAKATSAPSIRLGPRTKTAGCVVKDGKPDTECTPGAVLMGVTADDVCVPGYAKSVRNVSDKVKNSTYDEYSVKNHSASTYEVDHLVSLELGGSNEIENLWPEPASPRPGFHEKDKVENYLHDQVCHGYMSLKDAQDKIAHDWRAVYESLSVS